MIWNVTVPKDISGKDRSDAFTNPKRSDLHQSEAKRFVFSEEQREANLKESKDGIKTRDRNAQRHFKVTSPTPIHKRRRTRITITLRQSNKSRKT